MTKRINLSIDSIPCPICKESGTSIVWIGSFENQFTDTTSPYACANTKTSRPTVYRCNFCNHHFTDPLMWPIDLGSEYESVIDENYLKLEPIKFKTFNRAASNILRFFSRPSSLIEVGSYAGIFLDIMQAKGWDCVGIEPSSWGANYSRQKGLKVIQKSFEEAIECDTLVKVDLIASWDVLEHVKSPLHFLENCAKLLNKGGYLALSTLDRTNLFARLTKSKWPWIIEMHLHYFDQKTIIEAARSFGLELVETRAHVHYSTIPYMLSKIFGDNKLTKFISRTGFLDSCAIPVGFGDVRYYIFQKENTLE